jgi:hypothetical protein
MPRSYGFDTRDSIIDAMTVLVGAVKAGLNQSAETRTGAARQLTTDLSANMCFKAVLYGQAASAGGGYLLQAAHIPIGKAIGDVGANDWASIGVITANGFQIRELALSGRAIYDAVYAKGTVAAGTPLRAVAVRAVAGDGTNGASAPTGDMTICVVPDMG